TIPARCPWNGRASNGTASSLCGTASSLCGTASSLGGTASSLCGTASSLGGTASPPRGGGTALGSPLLILAHPLMALQVLMSPSAMMPFRCDVHDDGAASGRRHGPPRRPRQLPAASAPPRPRTRPIRLSRG